MQILLQHTGGKPIYEQIAEQMKAQILSGEIPAGEQLPSIRTLARHVCRAAGRGAGARGTPQTHRAKITGSYRDCKECGYFRTGSV